jgi:type IV fimbrial biogenesis protein FimT
MRTKASRRRHSGYTMLEALMVILIVSILGTIAIPSFRYVTNSNRIAGEVNALLGDLQFARSEAVKEGATVTVCQSTGPLYNACSTTSSDWSGGWIVFLDTNGDKVRQASEAIVRTQPALGGTDTFVATPGTFHAITYNRMGFAPTATAVNVTLHDSPTPNPNWTRCVAINAIGTAVTEKHGAGTPVCN